MLQRIQKALALILLLFLLVAIPLTVWFGVKQQQQTQQKASTNVWNGGIDSCGRVSVAFENENPSCPSGTAVTNTYNTTVRLKSADGKSHQVSYLFESFWCKDSSELGDGVNPTSCIKRVKADNKTITVDAGAGTTVASITQTASSYNFGSSCGVYQTDFSYTVDGTSCRFGYSALDPSPAHPVLAAGYCATGVTCSLPTSTPAPSPSVTPTPALTNTPTPTPGPTSTPGPTATPGPTSTPGPGPSSTPTPIINTPVPPTTTPRPTLPPTGPGDLLINIGLFGAAAVVVGTMIILAL